MLSKNFIRVLLCSLISLFSSSGHAENVTGTITGMSPPSAISNNTFIVKVSPAARSGTIPPCNTTHRYAHTWDNNGHGKELYSSLMAAYLSGKKVTLLGAGNCDAFGNSETIKYACIGDIPC